MHRLSSPRLTLCLLRYALSGSVLLTPACGKVKSTTAARCLFVDPMEAGPLVIDRLGYVLLDGSGSVQKSLGRIGSAVEHVIIDRAGVGDWLYGFRLHSKDGAFDERNILFGPDRDAPMVREGIARGRLSTERLNAGCDDTREVVSELENSWAKFEILRASWSRDVQTIVRTPPVGRSAYLASLEYLAARFSRAPKAMSRWLFIIGDARETQRPKDLATGTAARAVRDRFGVAFAGVHVRVLRPSGEHDDENERLWREYFATLGTSDASFYYLGEEHTAGFEPSAVPHLSRPAVASTR